MTGRARGAVVLAMILGGVACGGGSSNDNNPPAPNAITIMVKSTPTLEFKPRVDTVAQAGTVTWSWEAGSQDHNVISTGSPSFTSNGTATLPGTQDVDWFDAPHQYQFSFSNTGIYKYYCSTHGTSASPDNLTGMGGFVVVVP